MLQRSSGSTGDGTPPDGPEGLYLSHLKLIEELATHLARRNHMSVEESEDFASILKTKLLENDYERIRKFKGGCKFTSYLQTVAVNLFRDFRNHRWGKWRPSAEAERLGKVAVKLDELTSRDTYSFEEACQILLTNHRVQMSRDELVAMWTRIPPHPTRQIEGEEALQDQPAETERPEGRILDRELAATRKRVGAALVQALEALPKEDKLLVQMCIVDGWKVADTARALGLDQRPLYRRLEAICKTLKKQLLAEGIGWEQVRDLLNQKDVRW